MLLQGDLRAIQCELLLIEAFREGEFVLIEGQFLLRERKPCLR
jgi:hypothetical protein